MKFSIIMPTYNCEKYIGEAVKSVLEQTYADFELIIVDDGSTDGTFAICEQIVKGKDNVHLYAVCHGGVSVARNFGLEKACGEYVLFIDGDDSWKSDLLESIVYHVDDCCQLVVFGILQDWYTSDNIFQYSREDLGDSEEIAILSYDLDANKLFSAYNMASPCNKVYTRDIIVKNNLSFSEKCVYLEDLKFNFDYLQYVLAIQILKKDLYRYRLFINTKQIAKRNFGELFSNADELYRSCANLSQSKNWAFPSSTILSSMLIAAYLNEFIAHTYQKDFNVQKNVLSCLNNNQRYNQLLKHSRGKFFAVLRLCKVLHFRKIQLLMIHRRYM